MQLLKRDLRKFDPDFPHFMDDLNNVLEYQKRISPGDIYIICVPKAEVIPEEIHKMMVSDFIIANGREPVDGEVTRFNFKNRLITKETCPSPAFDQTLFVWKKSEDKLVLLWTLLSKEHCEEMRDDAMNVAPEWKENLKYVIDYYDGTLAKMVLELNKADKLRQDIVLRTYDDTKMTEKDNRQKFMTEMQKERKRVKLF